MVGYVNPRAAGCFPDQANAESSSRLGKDMMEGSEGLRVGRSWIGSDNMGQKQA